MKSLQISTRWVYGVSAAGLLVFGLIQFPQANAHDWILIAGAALILAGLILLARKLHWDGLVTVWGLRTGAAWYVGLLGSNDSFPSRGMDYRPGRGPTAVLPEPQNPSTQS